MKKVSVVKYKNPIESVYKAINLSNAFADIKKQDKVLIKPNIVYWSRHTAMPPWGVITTTRVIHDVIKYLKDMGVNDITIGEGINLEDKNDKQTPAHAFETLGYSNLIKKYGIKVVDFFDDKYESFDLGDDIKVNCAKAALESDFIVNLPVLKTHAQTKVSLSLKNLKGALDIKTRKKFHNPDPNKDLDYHVARLANLFPRMCCVIDGIYTIEKGPGFNGKARRSDIIVASKDSLAADLVGASLLGFEPSDIKYLADACKIKGTSSSIDSIETVGEKIEDLRSPHKWNFPYKLDPKVPDHFVRMGVKGLSFPKYDSCLCSYCAGSIGVIHAALATGFKGEPFDNVEILTGKTLLPSKNVNHTILFGKCQLELNKDNKDIKHLITIPGCPPKIEKITQALKEAGIFSDPEIVKNAHLAPAMFMKQYKGRDEFSHDFYRYNI